MSDEYTPTTEDVRNHYAYGCGPEHTWAESHEEFDRWLAQVRREAAAEALEEFARTVRDELAALRDVIEKVRAARAQHPKCDVHPEDDPVTCGWKRAVLDIDAVLSESHAAPREAEWEYALRGEGDTEPFSDVSADLDWLLDDGAPSDLTGVHVVRRHPAGPWLPVEGDNK